MTALFLLVVLGSCCMVYAHEPDGTWSYDESTENGPNHWADHWPQCGGTSQSPIDIPGNLQYNDSLTEFQFYGFDKETLTASDLYTENPGWTAKVLLQESSIGKAYFTGGGHDGKYLAAQLHFHWGVNNAVGSDHTLLGEHFPAELHIAFFKEEYGTIANALNYNDGAVILATFFEVSEDDNNDLEPFFNALDNIRYKGDTEPFPDGLEMFLPDDPEDYYRYHGSYTHPPCLEVITFTIFKKPRSISQSQLDKLRQLYDGEEGADNLGYILDNGRPVQPLNDRVVYRSFDPDSDEDDDSTSNDGDGGDEDNNEQ